MSTLNDGSGQSADSAAVSYHIPCQYRYLALIRDATLELGERLGLSDFDTYQLEMAVDEACTNIIEHGYGGERPPESDDPGIYVVFIEQERKIIVAAGKDPALATVIVRADGRARTGDVQQVIRICQEQGFERFALRALYKPE